MSLYGAEFVRNVDRHLRVPNGDPVDVNYCEKGYLLLATEKEQDMLRENYELQRFAFLLDDSDLTTVRDIGTSTDELDGIVSE